MTSRALRPRALGAPWPLLGFFLTHPDPGRHPENGDGTLIHRELPSGIGPSLDLVHGHHFQTFPGSENQRHPAACICHSRPILRSSDGYTNTRRSGRIAAMYTLPNRPFGFTSTAICAW
jgi:hypothetical protein